MAKNKASELPYRRAKAHAPWRWAAVALSVLTVLWMLTLLPSAPAASAPVRGPAVLAASSPSLPTPIQHVFEVLFENEGRSTVMSTAPYMASLANTYATPVDYYAVCHPSAPNYLSLSGGLSQQCGSDAYHVYTNPNLIDQITAKGLTWMDYQESMPKACDTSGSDNGGLYVVRHDPWVYYSSIVKNASLCDSHVVPLTQFDPNATPANFVWVTPNINDDGHNTNAATASKWLQGWLTPLLSEPWFASSVFLLVFDEGAGAGSGAGYSVGGIKLAFCGSLTVCGGNIWMTAVSPYSKGVGAVTGDATQYNLLSTIEWLLGVGGTGTGYDGTSNFPAMTGLFNFPPPPTQFPVSGVVHASNGSALAGAEVFANTSGNSTHVTTNQTGAFSFQLLNGTYELTAVAPGWIPGGENVTVAGAAVSGLVVTLSPSTPPTIQFRVSGTVEDTTGSALVGVPVFANSSVNSTVVTTNGTGGFSFQLPNGTYAVSAVAPGWVPSGANVTVAGAPVAGLVLTLSPISFLVNGTVVNASSGAPIANATVVVSLAPSPVSAKTSSTGGFSLELPAGTYPVNVSAFPYQSINRTLVVAPANLTPSFALTPAPVFAVNVSITSDAGNQTVKNATLVVSLPNGSVAYGAENGSLSLHLPNGTYPAKVVASGYVTAVVQLVVGGIGSGPIAVVLHPALGGALSPSNPSIPLAYLVLGVGAAVAGFAIFWRSFGPRMRRGRPPGPSLAVTEETPTDGPAEPAWVDSLMVEWSAPLTLRNLEPVISDGHALPPPPAPPPASLSPVSLPTSAPSPDSLPPVPLPTLTPLSAPLPTASPPTNDGPKVERDSSAAITKPAWRVHHPLQDYLFRAGATRLGPGRPETIPSVSLPSELSTAIPTVPRGSSRRGNDDPDPSNGPRY